MRYKIIFGICLAPTFVVAGTVDPHPNAPDIRSFTDRFMTTRMEKAHIPGAVFSAVLDGKVIMQKGYGYSNIAAKTPMSATDTVVRVASTSKLFTATAALQLKERGLLSFDQDVNSILSEFKVWSPFPKQVTMRHLLTHSAGFDERFIGLVSHTLADLMPLGPYLKARMPRVVYPPGEAINYSNHGFALAGHLIEIVSRKSFEEYMQDSIFKPLAMESSSFVVPERLMGRIAQGYDYHNGILEPQALDYVSTGPASSLITTASDMTHFMLVQLSGGNFNGKSILSTSSVEAMQAQQISIDKSMPGLGFSFFRTEMNGEMVLSHGGEVTGYNTLFVLFPRRKLGFFFCYNRFGSDLAKDYLKEFVDRFFPSTPGSDKGLLGGYWYTENLDAGQEAEEHTKKFRGFYRMIRHPHDGFTKIGAILSGFASEYWVVSSDRGREIRILTFPWLRAPQQTWQRTGPRHFRAVENGERLVFKSNNTGTIDYLAREAVPEGTFELIPWYESLWLHSVVHCLAMIVVLLQIIGLYRRKIKFTFTSFLLALVGVLSFLFIGGIGLFLGMTKPVEIAYGVPLSMQILLSLPLAAGIFAMGLPVVTWIERKKVFMNRRSSLRFLVQVTSIYAVLAVFHYWNFIGFKYY